MPTPIGQGDVLAIAPELASGSVGAAALSPQAWIEILAYVNAIDMTKGGSAVLTNPCTDLNVTLAETATTDRMAKLYLAAHMGTMVARAGTLTAGPLTSESVGDSRRSYGLLPMYGGASSYGATRYGQLYMQVVGASLKSLFVVV